MDALATKFCGGAGWQIGSSTVPQAYLAEFNGLSEAVTLVEPHPEVGGDIRVIGSIDDGGWRAFKPLTDDFIMRPDGTLV